MTDVKTELMNTLRSNIALCAELQNSLGYVLITDDCSLCLMVDGNQYRLAGIKFALAFQTRKTAERIRDLWNAQPQVQTTPSTRIDVLTMEAAAIRTAERAQELLSILEAA
jgi:hypothetical protein